MGCLCAQSCPTVCDPMDCSPPGSSVHGISQVRILEWIAISSSGGFSDPWIELVSPALVGKSFTTESLGKPICIHISTLLNSFPTLVITEHWIQFLVLHCRPLLVIYFIWSSVCMSVPTSQLISHPPLFSLVTISLFFNICDSVL